MTRRPPFAHRLLLETLEQRLLADAAPYPPTPAPGYTAAQIRHAYDVDSMSLTGQGERIVIVDAGLSPTLGADVATFDAVEGLPPISLQITAEGPLDQPVDVGWYLEETLDVEWAHAMAPGAQIVVVACSSASLFDLGAGVVWAGKEPGVAAVSLSWGGAAGGQFLDALYLANAANRTVVCASSGDQGGTQSWPAMSPAALSVGGTSLTLRPDGSYGGETAWSGSGGGPSAIYPGVRDPIISFVGDPQTGVQVWCTSYRDGRGWYRVGGTSVGAPCIAGLVALADQERIGWGENRLTTPQARDAAGFIPYTQCYHDVTTGAAGGNAAGPGYDYVTGYGSPIASEWVPYMARYVRPWHPISTSPFARQHAPTRAALMTGDAYSTLEVYGDSSHP